MRFLSLHSVCLACLLSIFAMPVRLVAQSISAEGKTTPSLFRIQDLGVVGTNFTQPGQPFVISDSGWVSGGSNVGSALHAVLWRGGQMLDIGNPGLGGNSIAFGVNGQGHAVGEAEDTEAHLSTTEDFCGFQFFGYSTSPKPCVPFISNAGKMFRLRTLGGVNGVANQINSYGLIAGYAENTISDPGCSEPQIYEFKPVVWYGDWVYELPTGNQKEGVAFSVNDRGQVVGASGSCAPFNPNFLFNFLPAHALLWQNGDAVDLGNLEGKLNNFAHDINNRGEVVGGSDVTGDVTSHAFLWTPQTKKMQDLGTVAADFWSVALGINDNGQIVGASANADFSVLRAFVRENGVLVDLNGLILGQTNLFLETACSINAKGEIIGLAFDPNTGDIHAYLALPTH